MNDNKKPTIMEMLIVIVLTVLGLIFIRKPKQTKATENSNELT